MADLILKNEVYQIVGAAFDVYNELGNGYLEAVYQEAMEYELQLRGVPFVSQAKLQIRYKDVLLSKYYVADLICYSSVLVELKSAESLTNVDEAQVINSLKATGLKVGLLANFGAKDDLKYKRLVY